MATPTLAMIPSGYKSEKVYSVLPTNGDGDLNFDRDTTATRVNKDGLIEDVLENVPRLDYSDSGCQSLLLEPESTNRIVNSENLSGSGWSNTNLIITSNQAISPSGELTADKAARTSTSFNYVRAYSTKTQAAQLNVVSSFFVKQGQGDFIGFRCQGTYPNRVDGVFQFSTKTLTTSISGSDFIITSSNVKEYGNGWYRLSVVYNTDAAAGISLLLSPRSTSGQVDATDTSTTSFAYFWGTQCEESNVLSSYIPTSGNIETRNVENCSKAGLSDYINSNEGVLYAEFKTHTELGTFRQITLSLNSSNRIYISKRGDNGNLEFRMNNPLGDLNFSFVQNTSDAYVKVAFRYEVNNFGVFINGVNKEVSTTGNTFADGTLTSLQLKSPIANQNFYGNVKDVRVYDTALTNSELITLTTI